MEQEKRDFGSQGKKGMSEVVFGARFLRRGLRWSKTLAAENNDEPINRDAYEHEAAKQQGNARLFF
jgi:hypothetical protein